MGFRVFSYATEGCAVQSVLPDGELVYCLWCALGTGTSEYLFTTADFARSLQLLVPRAAANTDNTIVRVGFLYLKHTNQLSSQLGGVLLKWESVHIMWRRA